MEPISIFLMVLGGVALAVNLNELSALRNEIRALRMELKNMTPTYTPEFHCAYEEQLRNHRRDLRELGIDPR